MSLRIILAASAALALAAPAFAQDAPVAPPAAVEAVDPAEAALEAKGEAFGERMQAMGGEMQAAITEAAGDQAKAGAALDAIVARYQPEADAFADELKAYFDTKAANAATEEEKAEAAAAGPMVVSTVRGVPAMVRGQIEQAATAAPAAAAAE